MTDASALSRAQQWLAIDRYEEALEAASEWLGTHPDDVDGLLVAADADLFLARFTDARELAGRALATDPDRVDGVRVLSQAIRRLGDAPEEAVATAQRWCELAPENSAAWCEAAECLGAAGRTREARAACRTAASLTDPTSAVDLCFLGSAHLAARENSAADRCVRAALAIDPLLDDAHGLRIRVDAARGRMLGSVRGAFDLLVRHPELAIIPQAARLILLISLGGACVVGGAAAIVLGIASIFFSPLRLAGLVVPGLLVLVALLWILIARRYAWRLLASNFGREGSRLGVAVIRIAVGLACLVVWALAPAPFSVAGCIVAVGAFIGGLLALSPDLDDAADTPDPEPLDS